MLSNQPAENAVLRFERQRDGSLVQAGSYATGGTGTGGGLGSQGAVTMDESGRYLYAVNAGSGSVSSFEVNGDGLELIDVVPSGGAMPTSVTVDRDVVYVLNAGDPGSISGFTSHDGDLEPLPGSTQPLSASGTQPAQVSFTPEGDRLIVTERATQRFSVYAVDRDGVAGGPTTVASAGVTPFGFDFDNRSRLIVSEASGGAADGSTVSSYDVRRDAFDVISPAVPTTETAACWIAITPNGRFAYSGNAASMSITGYAIGRDGELAILSADGKAASATAEHLRPCHQLRRPVDLRPHGQRQRRSLGDRPRRDARPGCHVPRSSRRCRRHRRQLTTLRPVCPTALSEACRRWMTWTVTCEAAATFGVRREGEGFADGRSCG